MGAGVSKSALKTLCRPRHRRWSLHRAEPAVWAARHEVRRQNRIRAGSLEQHGPSVAHANKVLLPTALRRVSGLSL